MIEIFKNKEALSSAHEDFMVTNIDYDGKLKKVISFCVVQIWHTGQNDYEIIKYDAAHGYCHIHRYYKNADYKTERIENLEISRETIIAVKQDIKENWEKYKRWYLARLIK